MPKMNGIRLAVKIKETHPDMHIIFLTGYAQYALEALRVHANGYLLKPIEQEQLKAEIDYAFSVKKRQSLLIFMPKPSAVLIFISTARLSAFRGQRQRSF